MPRYCPQCGRENNEHAHFCTGCGLYLVPELLDNRYEILGTVKAGAMGCVYKALDTRLNQIVALKKMIPPGNDPDKLRYAEQRFLQEARLLSGLHHSGLPKVTDFFANLDPGAQYPAHYLVMTFIEGSDLEALIAERRRQREGMPFPTNEVIGYFWQILEILNYLHTRAPPVIYRDLKPSNIMVGGEKIFLIDFGIARIFTPCRKGTMIGTPGYAAIEQYKGYAEPRSDLFSLGVVIHYLLTGSNPEDSSRPPFNFEPPGIINPQVPGNLSDLIMSTLELTIDKRPESAAMMMERLGSLLHPGNSQKPGWIRNSHKPGKSASKDSKSCCKKTTKKSSHDEYRNIFKAINQRDYDAVRELIENGEDVNIEGDEGTTPLHLASYLGCEEIIKLLIDSGARIDSKDIDESSPLHVAVAGGSLEVARLLIENGARINEKDIEGFTPLHVAAEENQSEISGLLIERGARVNAEGNNYSTPLHAAARGNSPDVALMLIACGADIDAEDSDGFTPLSLASQDGHLGVAEHLIEKGARVNLTSNDETSPLHWAAFKGYGRIADLLIRKGAELDGVDRDKSTPLHVAVAGGSGEVVELLLSKGADIEARDSEGMTPLHVAVQENRPDIVSTLMAKDARVSVEDGKGRTPLRLAALLGRKEILELISTGGAEDGESGADKLHASSHYEDIFAAIFAHDLGATLAFLDSGETVNERNVNGFTPLHCACGEGLAELSELFISRGADVHAKSNRGWTPLFSATIGNSREAAELLISKGAAVNAVDNQSVTPLHWASEKGYLDILQLLISKGANVKAKNNNGDTPIHVASKSGHHDVVTHLIKCGATVNAHNNEGMTPLHLASLHEQKFTAELLIYHGADVNSKDREGNTPLQRTYRQDIKTLLKKHGGV